MFVAQVPFDPVELEMNEKTQGLVSPEPFLLPIVSPLWTPVAYAAFDESNAAGKVRKGGGGQTCCAAGLFWVEPKENWEKTIVYILQLFVRVSRSAKYNKFWVNKTVGAWGLFLSFILYKYS